MLITATIAVPATHVLFEDVEDLCFGVKYSLEAETSATFVEVGYLDFGEVHELTVEFTWPGYLHEARAVLTDYRAEGETDAGEYSVRLQDLYAA